MAKDSGRRHILLAPLMTWAALFVLGAMSLGYTFLSAAPFKSAIALTIVVIQALVVLGAFMNLRKAGALITMTVVIAVVWLSFLFLMSFADLATR